MNSVPEWLKPRLKDDSYVPSAEDIQKIEPQSVTGVMLKYLADILVTKEQIKSKYEKQLESFGIESEPELVESAFKDDPKLWNNFCLKAVSDGFEDGGVLDSLIAFRQKSHKLDSYPLASTVELTPTGDPTVSEGGLLHTVSINTNSTIVKLSKHGRLFSISYQSLLKKNLMYIYKVFYKVGVDLMYEVVREVTKLFSSTSPTQYSSPFSYNNLINFNYSFSGTNQVNCLLANSTTTREILSLSEMKTPINLNSHGSYGTPHLWRIIRANALNDDEIIGFDSNNAFILVNDDFVVETRKLADRQLLKIGVSINFGVSKFLSQASKFIKVDQ